MTSRAKTSVAKTCTPHPTAAVTYQASPFPAASSLRPPTAAATSISVVQNANRPTCNATVAGICTIKGLECTHLIATATSSGDLRLQGKCEQAKYTASSSGDIDAGNMEARHVDANASSAGDISVPRLGIAECPHKRRREHRLFGESRASIRFRQRHTKALTSSPRQQRDCHRPIPGQSLCCFPYKPTRALSNRPLMPHGLEPQPSARPDYNQRHGKRISKMPTTLPP